MSECIEWWGTRNSDGYGVFKRNGKSHYAHRNTYEECFGPIPQGMFILHSCDNPPCVNPEHLRAGTPGDNVKDMYERNRQRYRPQNSLKTECIHGHPLSGENLYVQEKTGKRYCRECQKRRRRAHQNSRQPPRCR